MTCSWVDSGFFAISGRELAESLDCGGDHLQGIIDIGLRGMAAETKTEACAGFVRGQTYCGQDV